MTGGDVTTGMRALNVALAARAGTLGAGEVDEARQVIEQLTDPGDPLRYAMNAFHTQYQVLGADPDALARLGAELADAVTKAAVPVPPGGDRRDLHG